MECVQSYCTKDPNFSVKMILHTMSDSLCVVSFLRHSESECRKDIHTWYIAYCTFSIQTCRVVSPTQLLCMIPELTTVISGANLDYSLTFDGQVLSNLSSIQPLRAVADPVFDGSSPTQYAENSNVLLTISVSTPGIYSTC